MHNLSLFLFLIPTLNLTFNLIKPTCPLIKQQQYNSENVE